jgi:hypothetical protein
MMGRRSRQAVRAAATIAMIVPVMVSPIATTVVSATQSVTLPKLPFSNLAGSSYDDAVLVPVTIGSGSRQLRSYTPHGKTLYIQFSCEGKGTLTLTGYFKLSSCNVDKKPDALLDSYPKQAGRRVSPKVIAAKGVTWEFLITSGP